MPVVSENDNEVSFIQPPPQVNVVYLSLQDPSTFIPTHPPGHLSLLPFQNFYIPYPVQTEDALLCQTIPGKEVRS